jgi:hypothetical protein
MIGINSENKKDFRFSMYIVFASFISSSLSLLILFFLKDKIVTALMLNAFATTLLAMPYFILLLNIIEKRIKEQQKEADDKEKEGQQ